MVTFVAGPIHIKIVPDVTTQTRGGVVAGCTV